MHAVISMYGYVHNIEHEQISEDKDNPVALPKQGDCYKRTWQLYR